MEIIADDGCAIHFADEGTGRPLLFVHGLAASSRSFDWQARALADRFRVVRLDLRGHGATRACGALTMDRAAADVRLLAETLDLRDAVLIGWSLGAMLVWDVLMSPASARFVGAVTIDMTARVANDATWSLGLIDEGFRSLRPGEDWAMRGRRIAEAIVADPANAAVAAWLGEELGRSDPAAVAALGASMMERDYRDSLGAIATPTLIVHGARSVYYAPATSAFLAARLANARVVPFAGSGHAPHLEEPNAFNRLLTGFVEAL